MTKTTASTNPMHQYKIDSKVRIYNIYTGRYSTEYIVIAITPKYSKVTIARPDFATGKEAFNFQPATGNYSNAYSGVLHLVG